MTERFPAPPRAVYVHVPFCRRRCGYCDFTLVAGRDDMVDGYFAALARELQRIREPLPASTLYLGGGTPSHLGPRGIRRLHHLLRDRLVPDRIAEFTMEANPNDVSESLLEAASECGVTRVSLGAQSLDATTLKSLDRDHSPDDILRATELCLGHGLAVNVDLMTAAPGQSLAAVEADLAGVIGLGVQHVSVYCLTWEKGTRFESSLRRGGLVAADEMLERAMFEAAIDRLEAAQFEHYEISNFARPGHRCRHNEGYWDCRPWEAFGPGAARCDGRERITNHRSVFTWMKRVLEGRDATGERETFTPWQAAIERVILGLRRRDGIDRAAFLAASGFTLDQVVGAHLERWMAAGLATDDGSRTRLTRAGMLVSDGLWAPLLRAAVTEGELSPCRGPR